MTESFIKDFNSPTEAAPVTLRFVRVKFTDRESPKEYTYRIEPDASVYPGQYAITRRNMSRVTITVIDCEPVPGLDLSKYDFVDPVSDETDLLGSYTQYE
jgi:hypothetical protein